GGVGAAAVITMSLVWHLPPAYWPAALGIAAAGGAAVGCAAAVWGTPLHHPISTGKMTVTALLAALVGHCVDLLVGFGTAGVSMLAYVLLGVLLAGPAEGRDEEAPAYGLALPALTGAGLTAVLVAAEGGGRLELLPLTAVMWLAGMVIYAPTVPARSWGEAVALSLLPAVIAGAGVRAAGGDPRWQMLAGAAGMLTCMLITAVVLKGSVQRANGPARVVLWRMAGAVVLAAGLVGAGWPATGDAYLTVGRRALLSGDWGRVDSVMQTAVRFPPYDALAYDVWAQRWLAVGRLAADSEARSAAVQEAVRMLAAAWKAEPLQVEWARRLSAVYREWAENEAEPARRLALLREARQVLAKAVRTAPANLALREDLQALNSLLQEVP
ncbi:MAG: hypothetical protein ACP5TV_10920, partial [Anaerolineae bacterium]